MCDSFWQSYTVDKWIKMEENSSYVSRKHIEYIGVEIGVEGVSVVVRMTSGNKYLYAKSKYKEELDLKLLELLNRITENTERA